MTEDIAEKAVRHLVRRAGFAEVKIIDLDPEIANAWRFGIAEKDSNVFRFPYLYSHLDIFVMTSNACQRTLVPSWTTEESILVQLDVLNASE